jgi:hypothetical protein
MAARGARSRKIVEKQITKENTKKSEERFMPHGFTTKADTSRVMSPVAGWNRKHSQPSGASTYSGDSGGSSGRLSAAGSKLSSTLASVTLRDDTEKFVDKGKQTSAPRGRGGGVPTKASEAKADRANVRAARRLQTSHSTRPSSRAATITNDFEIPAGVKSWERTKIWHGGLTGCKPYTGFDQVRPSAFELAIY